MKQKLTFLLLIIFLSLNGFGQKLTLTDLASLCNKKNWEDVNQFMLIKGWTYYNSEEGSDDKYNTITWSYNKEDYSDKAQGWFYLYTFDNYPNKIFYSIFNKTSYLLIQNSLITNGFKLIDSEIEDEKVISTYANLGYTLKISNSKRKDEDWSDRSLTAYSITLIKKAGVYDAQNGEKTDYYENDIIKAEYNLINGKINGLLKFYDENGNLQKTTNYINGIASGKVVEYKETGEKNAEYLISNDSKNGLLTFYENNKISYTTTFKNDLKNGKHINYYYDGETDNLFLKEYGQYLDDKKNETWKTYYIDGKNEKLLTYTNYLNDLKDGLFQEVQGDSLIVGNYKEDELHGNYKIYFDQSKFLSGGLINTDISKLKLLTEGQYTDGNKSGNWKIYDITGTLRSEENYNNNLESGEWKYYYPNWIKKDGKPEKNAKELFLTQNYYNGKLNGKSTRFSYENEVRYPCDEMDENGIKLDTCSRYVFRKILETSYFKDNELNGPYELRDSINQIISKGKYLNGLKDGEWQHKYTLLDIDNKPYNIFKKGKYVNNTKEGKWIQYLKEDEISEILKYENGKLKELISLDSLGIKKNMYEIYEEKLFTCKVKKTVWTEVDGYFTQEYWYDFEKEIEDYYFEPLFLIAVDKELSDGTKGYKDGAFCVYKEDKPYTIGKYYKEDRVGLWTNYYYDQNIKIESNFNNDELENEKYIKLSGELFSGEFEYLNNEKNIKEIRKIKDGLRNGKTSYVDLITNKTVNKETYKDGKLKE
ncbi:hypothetical protein [Flavobacterium sp.]|uniref:hypothetical protein n=1 Tax=Flavobacterium sp. TaxID=239 RepID=UPI0037C0F9EF